MKVLVILLASFGMLVKAQLGDRGYGGYQQQGYQQQQQQHPTPDYGPPGYAAAPVYGPPAYRAPAPVGYAAAPSIGAPQPHFTRHQAPIVHKHVYVHVPPPEPYFPKPRKALPPPPPPQKHYKIIFIKAPTPAPVELPDVPVIPQAPEVKTLVYVLTKKPEPLPELNIPIPPPPAQHKPEVFFIRYKTPGDLEDAVLNAGGPAGGAQYADENEEAILGGGFNPQQDGNQRHSY